MGTLDIDLALDFRYIPDGTYHTALEALEARGYRQDRHQPKLDRRDRCSRSASGWMALTSGHGEAEGSPRGHPVMLRAT